MKAVHRPSFAAPWARCAAAALLLLAAGSSLAGDALAPAGIEEARRAVADGAWPRARAAIEALEQAHAAPDDPARPAVEALRAEFVARRKAFLSRFAGDLYPLILRRWIDAEVRRPRIGWDEVARRVGNDAARETFDGLLAEARRLDPAVTRDEAFDAWRERPRTEAMWQRLEYGPLGAYATAPPPPPGVRADTGARDLAWRKAPPADRLQVFLAVFIARSGRFDLDERQPPTLKREDCQRCEGTGLLTFEFSNGAWVTVACPRCNNGKPRPAETWWR